MIVTVLLLGLALILAYIGSRRKLTQAHLLFVTLFFASGVAVQVANEVLRVAPRDSEALRYSQLARNPPETPEMHLNLSLAHFQNRRYEECIRAARAALRLKPDCAEAYNNLAAAYQSLGRWDEAVAAAREALRLKPDFPLARNNLKYALSQKAQAASASPNPRKSAANLQPPPAGWRPQRERA